jgi:lipid II:glycine glycyltransferase (peptidoglycan interpeptide bridge formation enzyme)
MRHFLQSDHWKALQEKLGRRSISRQGEGWRYTAYLETGRLSTRLYAPYGPEADSEAALEQALQSLRTEAKKLGASFVRFEPGLLGSDELFARLGAVRSARVQPEATSVVDLSQNADAIVSRMSPSSRNLYRNYAKKGVTIRSTTDVASIEVLLTFLHEVAEHTGMKAHSDEYLRAQAETFFERNCAKLYVGEFEGSPIVACLVYDYDGVRYYAHAAAGYEHRNLSAGTSIVGQMILDAKNDGMTAFDLYGIWPDADNGTAHGGITKFKRSFGGDDRIYRGTWELPVKPLQYRLYRLVASRISQRT